MRTWKLAAAAFTLLAAPLFGAKAVLLVNGVEVTDTQLEFVKGAIRSQAGAEVADADVMKIALSQVIGQVLITDAALKAGVSVTAADVDALIERQREATGGAAAFDAELKKAGITFEELRAFESARILAQRYVETKVAPSVTVTEDEVRRYYDANREEFKHEAQWEILMILAATPPGAPASSAQEALARAEQARRRLVAGEDFAVVAKEMSDDPSAAKGGLVGWVRKGMLLPSLEPAVLALEDGQTSDVLKSHYGYHIFRVLGRRGAGEYPFGEVAKDLTEVIRRRKVIATMSQRVDQWRSAASILALDPEVQAALADGSADAPR